MPPPTAMPPNDITKTFGMPIVTAALIVIIAGCRSCAHPGSVIRFTALIRLMGEALIGRVILMAGGAFASSLRTQHASARDDRGETVARGRGSRFVINTTCKREACHEMHDLRRTNVSDCG